MLGKKKEVYGWIQQPLDTQKNFFKPWIFQSFSGFYFSLLGGRNMAVLLWFVPTASNNLRKNDTRTRLTIRLMRQNSAAPTETLFGQGKEISNVSRTIRHGFFCTHAPFFFDNSNLVWSNFIKTRTKFCLVSFSFNFSYFFSRAGFVQVLLEKSHSIWFR